MLVLQQFLQFSLFPYVPYQVFSLSSLFNCFFISNVFHFYLIQTFFFAFYSGVSSSSHLVHIYSTRHFSLYSLFSPTFVPMYLIRHSPLGHFVNFSLLLVWNIYKRSCKLYYKEKITLFGFNKKRIYLKDAIYKRNTKMYNTVEYNLNIKYLKYLIKFHVTIFKI